MSPASSGPTLEVERYIGACLISSQQSRHYYKKGYHHHQQQQQQQGHSDLYRLQRCNSGDTHWTGTNGMPLLFNHHHYAAAASAAATGNENLSRLAVQTQGIPLILSNNKYHNRQHKQRWSSAGTSIGAFSIKDKKDQCTADTVSIASDESCTSSTSSNNSDTCLPRIIKPRKRRKKDRKPQQLQQQQQQQQHHLLMTDENFSGSSATSSPDIIDFTNFTPSLHHHHHHHQQQQQARFFNYPAPSGHVPISISYSSSTMYAEQDKNETPKLSHLFEDVLEDLDAKDLNGNESSCQCRYCDPNGQIWDMARGCYSPSLTTPSSSSSSSSSSRVPCSMLDGFSMISLDDKTATASGQMMSTPNSPNLEVSTEIVTSHNGHRDLEIKFFSIFNASAAANSGKEVPKSDIDKTDDDISRCCSDVKEE